MKKIFFGIIATVFMSYNSNAQDKFTDDEANASINYSTNTTRISCKRFSVGVNILVAWVETDVYVACGFPAGTGIGGWNCMFVTESYCNLVNGKTSNGKPSNKLNLKDFFKDVDISKVDVVEITKSTTWLNDDKTSSTIKTGKYPVDKDGNFEVEILLIK